MHGEHSRPRLGLRRVCDVWLRESGGSTIVDVSFRAEITTEGAVVGAAAAVIFLPVAVVGGAFSWAEFDSDANGMLNGFRQYTYAVALALHERKAAPAPFAVPSRYYDPFDASTVPARVPAPTPAGGTIATPASPPRVTESVSTAPPTRPASVAGSSVGACAHCGAPIYPGWKACPSCGERIPGTWLK